MKKTHILSGVDNISQDDSFFRGKRLGLITHPAGVDHKLHSTIEILYKNYKLTALFACEHGIRGSIQAGDAIDTYTDEDTGIPVYTLFGQNKRIDPAILNEIDIIVYDMQDIGVRFYTYLYSLSYAMEDCAAAGKTFVVLDRINPLGGQVISGTILNETFHSFVGEYAIPSRYALTIGEYALWVKDHLKLDLNLKIVPLSGWNRSMLLENIDIPWVAPSPNCTTLNTIIAYLGTCIFEGTNLSEGRGTTLPFEVIGAPWLNHKGLVQKMQKLEHKGVGFRPTNFKPTFGKYKDLDCNGVQLHILNYKTAQTFEAGLHMLDIIRDMHPDCFDWNNPDHTHIDNILGTDLYSNSKLDATGIIKYFQPLLKEYGEQRKPFLLYD